MEEKSANDFLKRKKINPKIMQDFQIWLLVRIMGASLLALMIAGLLSYLYAKNVMEADFLRFQTSTRTIGEIFLPVFLAASLTTIVAGLFLALYLPMKIAGPIYRVEQDLKQVGSGDLTKTIRLRSGDILKDFASSVNTSVANIGGLVGEIKKSGKELEKKILAAELEETINELELLKKQLDRITTKP